MAPKGKTKRRSDSLRKTCQKRDKRRIFTIQRKYISAPYIDKSGFLRYREYKKGEKNKRRIDGLSNTYRRERKPKKGRG